MSEIKSLNGYKLVDETARTKAEENAKAIAAINQTLVQEKPLLSPEQLTSIQKFASLFPSLRGKAESFLFFADPHLCGSTNIVAHFESWLNQISEVYHCSPCSMAICAGDWLNNSNTIENASWLMGVIDGAMKRRFNRYINILGNHDTNYQGYEYIQSGIEDKTYDRNECTKCQLSTSAIRGLWYRQQGNAYFAVDGDCTRFYVFDSGLDWYNDMTEYRWEQVHWFAQSLLSEKPERAAIIMHIVTQAFASTVLQIAVGYNQRTIVTLNGQEYDFSKCKGTVGFVLGGHEHWDYSFVHQGIPVIVTTNLRGTDGSPRFDLVLVDWDSMKIHLTRVGEGEDRTMILASN